VASHETSDRVRLVRDAVSGVEAIRARFGGHAYDLHRHDEWLVGVTGHGVQDFFCRGERQRSTPGRVILIEPGELHDGQAGTEAGFAYCMLYLPQDWPLNWPRTGFGPAPRSGPGFSTILVDDSRLATAIRRACHILGRPPHRLALDAAFDALRNCLGPHLGRPTLAPGPGRDAAVARRAREFLHDVLAEDIGADALARAAGATDRFQLARAFRAAYGTAPHAWLVQTRLIRARALLRDGNRPAFVAAECGFADQSHLGRWFRRAYGITPAAYQAICTGIPDRTTGAHR